MRPRLLLLLVSQLLLSCRIQIRHRTRYNFLRQKTKPPERSTTRESKRAALQPVSASFFTGGLGHRVEPLEPLLVFDHGFAVFEVSLERPHPLRQC